MVGMRQIFLSLILVCLCANPAHSTTIAAANCESATINTALASAVSGDTITVPAGTCTWTGGAGVAITKDHITLRGAGVGSTIINHSDTNGLILTVSAAANNVMITGFTFSGTATTDLSDSILSLSGEDFIVHDNVFTSGGATNKIGRTVIVNSVSGLFYNNVWDKTCNETIFLRGPCNSWQTDTNLGGSTGIVFLEDNNATKGTACGDDNLWIDMNADTRTVIRHNKIGSGYHLDAHGSCSDTNTSCSPNTHRGARQWEIYNNTFRNAKLYGLMELLAGTGLVFDNLSDRTDNDTTVNSGIKFYNMCWYNSAKTCFGYSGVYCCPSDYPIIDQIGVGKDPRTAASEPVYIWGNVDQDAGPIWVQMPVLVSVDPSVGGPSTAAIAACGAASGAAYTAAIIAPNRDYYNENASFDGTSGVGVGLLSARPATCTTGVAYWATDQGSWNFSGSGGQGILYKCTSTNNWDYSYMPYQYPHPSRITAAIAAVTPVPTPISNVYARYTFSSNAAGTIDYGGACGAGNETTAIVGNNTVRYGPLGSGTYSNCTVSVAGSNVLTVNSPSGFVVQGPTVAITSPSSGAILNGTLTLTATCDNSTIANATYGGAVSGVQWMRNQQNIGTLDTSSPFTVDWNTLFASNQAWNLKAVCSTVGGVTSTASIPISVYNPTSETPLTLSGSGGDMYLLNYTSIVAAGTTSSPRALWGASNCLWGSSNAIWGE